ncbi:ABC transporter permease, partial [Streptococcus agalactiae]
MNWSRIWELVKINILYSNPQTLSALRKKQEKHPKKEFSAYKSMFRNQLFQILLFSIIYVFLFVSLDFKEYPGYFTFYIGIFTLVSIIYSFIAMYSVFYESDDVKQYAYLPIKSEELYVAKIFATFGMSVTFLMPILTLMIVAYWRIIGGPLAVLLAIINFAILFLSVTVISLYINSLIGRAIIRSANRKLISTILISLATFGAIVPLLFVNMTSQKMVQGKLQDIAPIPYVRGYYDIVTAPFSMESLLNYYLPLLIILFLIGAIYKWVMPRYYQELLYGQVKQRKVHRQIDFSKRESINKTLVKHHLSSLQNATLLTNTFLMPLLYLAMFIVPILNNGKEIGRFFNENYFGIAFLAGILIGSLCVMPASIVGVGISLEKSNFYFIKSLPISFSYFLKHKFVTLITLQLAVPTFIYFLVGFFLLKLSILVLLSFILGLVFMGLIEGQFIYRRDYKHLFLNWQEVTQLFNRGLGQWLLVGSLFGMMIIGSFLIGISIFWSMVWNTVAVNIIILIIHAVRMKTFSSSFCARTSILKRFLFK